MKKFAKAFLGVLAALAIGSSFTGCEALMGALLGSDQTLKVESDVSAFQRKEVTLTFEEYLDNSEGFIATGKKETMTLVVGAVEKNFSDVCPARTYCKVYVTKIGTESCNIQVTKAPDSSSGSNYASFSGPDDDIFLVAGNGAYVVKLYKDGKSSTKAELFGTMLGL